MGVDFVRVRAAGGQNASRDKSARRWMAPPFSYDSEEPERFESGSRPFLGEFAPSRGIREALTRSVHGCPQTVVIAVLLCPLALVARPFRANAQDGARGRAP